MHQAQHDAQPEVCAAAEQTFALLSGSLTARTAALASVQGIYDGAARC